MEEDTEAMHRGGIDCRLVRGGWGDTGGDTGRRGYQGGGRRPGNLKGLQQWGKEGLCCGCQNCKGRKATCGVALKTGAVKTDRGGGGTNNS